MIKYLIFITYFFGFYLGITNIDFSGGFSKLLDPFNISFILISIYTMKKITLNYNIKTPYFLITIILLYNITNIYTIYRSYYITSTIPRSVNIIDVVLNNFLKPLQYSMLGIIFYYLVSSKTRFYYHIKYAIIAFGLGSIWMLLTWNGLTTGERMGFGISSLQSNSFGAFQAQVFILFIFMYRYKHKVLNSNNLYRILLFAIGLCLLFSLSRAAYLGILFGIIIYIIINKKIKLLPSLIITSLVLYFISPDMVKDRITENWQTHSISKISQGRTELWAGALNYSIENADRLIFGGGIYDFRTQSMYYSGLSYETYPHNLYLFVLTRSGLLSLSILLIIFLTSINISYKNYKYYKNENNRFLWSFSEGSFYLFIITTLMNFFGDRFINNAGIFFWVLLASNYYLYSNKKFLIN